MNLNPFNKSSKEPAVARVLKYENAKKIKELRQETAQRAEKLNQVHALKPFKTVEDLYKLAATREGITLVMFYERHPDVQKTVEEVKKLTGEKLKLKLDDDLQAFTDLLKVIHETKSVTLQDCKLQAGKWQVDEEALEQTIDRTCRTYAVGEKDIAVWDLQRHIAHVLNMLTPPEQAVMFSQGIAAMVCNEWTGRMKGGYLETTPFIPVSDYEFRPLINGGFDCVHSEARQFNSLGGRPGGGISIEEDIAYLNNIQKAAAGELVPERTGERVTLGFQRL